MNCLFFLNYPEIGGRKLPRNIGNRLPTKTSPQPKKTGRLYQSCGYFTHTAAFVGVYLI